MKLIIALLLFKEKGDFKYVQLYYNYYAGKPRESRDITIIEDVPIFINDAD